MLNEEKIILMTKLAIYEKGEGKKEIPMSRYYRNDYVGVHMLYTFLCVTAGYVLLFALYIAMDVEGFLSSLTTMDLKKFLFTAVAIYAVAVLFSLFVAWIVYRHRFKKNREHLNEYYGNLKKLKKIQKQEQEAAIKMAGGETADGEAGAEADAESPDEDDFTGDSKEDPGEDDIFQEPRRRSYFRRQAEDEDGGADQNEVDDLTWEDADEEADATQDEADDLTWEDEDETDGAIREEADDLTWKDADEEADATQDEADDLTWEDEDEAADAIRDEADDLMWEDADEKAGAAQEEVDDLAWHGADNNKEDKHQDGAEAGSKKAASLETAPEDVDAGNAGEAANSDRRDVNSSNGDDDDDDEIRLYIPEGFKNPTGARPNSSMGDTELTKIILEDDEEDEDGFTFSS